MINPKDLFDEFARVGVEFYTGVPDSLLKDFCAFVTDQTTSGEHIIATNEGGAIALAAGYHLATNKTPLIYFQNSGLGNATNPLLSLASKGVYSIPMILLIGWRGEPNSKDEPQHLVQGEIQNDLLKAMKIPYWILDGDEQNLSSFVHEVVSTARNESKPVAIVVRKNAFHPYDLKEEIGEYEMTREEALTEVLKQLDENDIVISTTGKLSRELYEYRIKNNQNTQGDFLTVGSMGHASQIALGIALNSSKKVYCLDGDGAALMHLGSFAIIGESNAANLTHLVFNNGSHESVGGQPTLGFKVDFKKIAASCGYKNVTSINSRKEIGTKLKQLENSFGPNFIEIRVNKGSRLNLSRPKDTPETNKVGFMKKLASS